MLTKESQQNFNLRVNLRENSYVHKLSEERKMGVLPVRLVINGPKCKRRQFMWRHKLMTNQTWFVKMKKMKKN